ncbi:MAG: ABC transporter substrate-binding protein [Oscillospiraceae bacterium]
MKKIKLLSAVLASLLLFTACGNKDVNSSSDTSQKEIIMATEAGFAPYEYYDGDKIIGVDVDIANEIAKAMGAKLKIVDMDFGAIITAVDTGKATFGAAGLSVTPERAKQVDFSIEYAISQQVILVNNDSKINGEDDLSGKTIGCQLGTVADLYIADMENAKGQQYVKYADAANDLLNGRIDAIVMDKLPAENLIKTHTDIKILEKPLFTDKYALAIKKGDSQTLEAVNTALQKLIDEGKIEEFTINHTSK